MSYIVTPHFFVGRVETSAKVPPVRAAISISGTHHALPTPIELSSKNIDLLELSFDDDGLSGGRQVAQRLYRLGLLTGNQAPGYDFDEAFNAERKAHWVTLPILRTALEFGRKHKELLDSVSARMLVHCFAGHSRSPAILLTILAQHFGAGREAHAIDAMLASTTEHNREPQPSSMVVIGADYLLKRRGALFSAFKARGF